MLCKVAQVVASGGSPIPLFALPFSDEESNCIPCYVCTVIILKLCLISTELVCVYIPVKNDCKHAFLIYYRIIHAFVNNSAACI